MFKKVRQLALATSLFAAVLVAGTGVANAETATIIGGTLNATNSPITFTDVTLDLTQIQKSSAATTITVDDARGTGAGWSYSLAISDFSASIPDPSGGSGNISVAIPATFVQYAVGSPSLISGQDIHATYGPTAGSAGTLSTSAQPIVNASPGFGMGQYSAQVSFDMTIPKTIQVKGVTGSGGKLAIGETVGIFAGTYTSTFTFTTGVGL